MKKSIKTFLLLAFCVATTNAFAQGPAVVKKTASSAETPVKSPTKGIEIATFKVKGVCGMCKRRIEEACILGGVKYAVWSSDTQVLTVKFDGKRTSLDKIKASVVKSGHDIDGTKAEDKTYSKLPACCQYREEGAMQH